MKKIIIALDGPAGSGKSTTARLVAEKLGYTYVDTGAMYRAITLAALEQNIQLEETPLTELVKTIEVELRQSPKGQRTFLNGVDVSERIRETDVTANVSVVSAISSVRQKMVFLQKRLGKSGGIVMDGRDIGTVVFPQAELKVFMVADIRKRAARRYAEMGNTDNSIEDIAALIAQRDILDSTREISPLTKADDAVEIDTSDLTIQQQVEMILQLAEQKISSSC
ncbi:MAG: (d)CMP kinase [Candidatus Kapabacteria bacterium]|nr:(d)CMP kinase [Candidatus Kapabacteria bacterium]